MLTVSNATGLRARRGVPGSTWFVIAAALLALHCENLVPAIGSNGAITLVSNLPTDSAAEVALVQSFERDVDMVSKEPAFRVERAQVSRLPALEQARNLVLLADLSRDDALAERVVSLVGEDLAARMRAGERHHVFLTDVWAKGQTLLVVAAGDAAMLTEAVEEHADSIYSVMDKRVTEQTIEVIFMSGEQESFSRYLRQQYGWSIRVPRGYRVSEDAEARVVRLWMPEGGTRLVMVHWQDGMHRLPDVESAIDLRARLVWSYDEDTILRDRTRSNHDPFEGRRALNLEGVWQNERYTKGGPFRTHFFLEGDRLYMIDLLVFDPDNPKINLMRQVEAIALTFTHGEG